MTEASRRSELLSRVANLSAVQRHELARHLKDHGASSAPHQPSLAAWLVTDSDGPNQQAIADYTREHLPSSHRPKTIYFVDEIPKTANGKVDRRNLTTVQSTSTIATEHLHSADSETTAFETIAAICGDIANVSEVRPRDRLVDLGIDSFLSIQLVALARRKGISIEPRDVLESRDIGELARRSRTLPQARPTDASLSESGKEISVHESSTRVFEVRPGTGSGSILFAHEVGGNCQYAQHLCQVLAPEWSLLLTEQEKPTPGSEQHITIPMLAKRYVDDWLQRDPNGPHSLLSFCWGGLLAYEMAQEFERRGRKLHMLGIIEFGTEAAYQYAPMIARQRDWWSGAWVRLTNRFRGNGLRGLGSSLGALATRWFGGQPNEKPTASNFEFESGVGDPDLIAHNVDLYFEYPIARSRQQIDLYRVQETPLLGSTYIDQSYGWRYLVGDENVHVHFVEGEHLDCVGPEHALSLAEYINQRLDCGNPSVAMIGKNQDANPLRQA